MYRNTYTISLEYINSSIYIRSRSTNFIIKLFVKCRRNKTDFIKWLKKENKETLTPQDALLTVALCAAATNADSASAYLQRLAELARLHPLFSDDLDAVVQKIEALFPLVHSTDPGKASEKVIVEAHSNATNNTDLIKRAIENYQMAIKLIE